MSTAQLRGRLADALRYLASWMVVGAVSLTLLWVADRCSARWLDRR